MKGSTKVEVELTCRGTPPELRRIVDEILKSSSGVPAEKVILRVIAACAAFFAVLLATAKAKQEAHRSWAARFEKSAKTLEELLKRIPVEAGGRTFALPASTWIRAGFFLLLALGGVTLVGEVLNFGYFLRFRLDSVFWGVVFSLPLFVLPLAEAALLNGRWVSEEARHRAIKIQGAVAVLLMALYVYYSLDYGDSSISQIFSDQKANASTERLRMLFQVLTSLCLCTICFSVALACGETKAAINPYYESVRERINAFLGEAEIHKEAEAQWTGEIEWIENTKREQLLYAQIKLERIDSANRTHAATIESILNS